MSAKVITRLSRENRDWYRVKYKLASVLVNDAYVQDTSFDASVKEVDELLAVAWRMLAPGWGRRWAKNAQLRRFLREIVEPPALSLKAIADLGLSNFEPGEAQGLDLKETRETLQAGKVLSPQTIIEAVLREKKQPGKSLCFDLACFFQLSGDSKRAQKYMKKEFEQVAPDQVARMRARVAVDPMLETIPLPRSVAEAPDKAPPKRAWI